MSCSHGQAAFALDSHLHTETSGWTSTCCRVSSSLSSSCGDSVSSVNCIVGLNKSRKGPLQGEGGMQGPRAGVMAQTMAPGRLCRVEASCTNPHSTDRQATMVLMEGFSNPCTTTSSSLISNSHISISNITSSLRAAGMHSHISQVSIMGMLDRAGPGSGVAAGAGAGAEVSSSDSGALQIYAPDRMYNVHAVTKAMQGS